MNVFLHMWTAEEGQWIENMNFLLRFLTKEGILDSFVGSNDNLNFFVRIEHVGGIYHDLNTMVP